MDRGLLGAKVRVFSDPDELGIALAREILTTYEESGERFLLGCPCGRSLRSTYNALASVRADLSRCTMAMMDEYVPTPPRTAHYSCHAFAEREIATPLGIPDERVWFPDPDDPSAFDERIDAAGGIDVFLLGSGASDGHVAFLPPGSPLDGRTSVVRLAESTRRDNLNTFPEFASLDDVPKHGVSIGLGTIARARRIRLVMHGAEKRSAASRVRALGKFDPCWPASVVWECNDAEIWLDRSAAGE